jgi:hypothetical protein
MYLIYATEQDAWTRSETEGIERGLAYHVKGKGSSFNLTDEEASATVDSYTPKPEEE